MSGWCFNQDQNPFISPAKNKFGITPQTCRSSPSLRVPLHDGSNKKNHSKRPSAYFSIAQETHVHTCSHTQAHVYVRVWALCSGTHRFKDSSTCPPFCSISWMSALLSSIFSRINSTVRFRTMPSDRPWPSIPGTSSVSRSKPSLIACLRFCSVRGAKLCTSSVQCALESRCKGTDCKIVLCCSPDAIWFCFFSSSVSRGFSSCAPGEVDLVGVDIAGVMSHESR